MIRPTGRAVTVFAAGIPAALLIVKKNGGVWLHNDVVLKLQVDDNAEPIKELKRLVMCAAASRQIPRSPTAPPITARPADSAASSMPRPRRVPGEPC